MNLQRLRDRKNLHMRNFFTFATMESRDWNVYISGTGIFNSPTRAYEPIAIPGRDGDILGAEKRLENIEVVYPCFIYQDFKTSLAGLRRELLYYQGYNRLFDTYNPDEFRMAYYAGGLEVEPTQNLGAGQFDIRFMCKPQRYLFSGLNEIIVSSTTRTIMNPYFTYAKPELHLYGKGTLTINDDVLTITTAASPYTVVDCELMIAYAGTQDRNKYLKLSGNDFPVLKPGMNTVSYTGFSSARIIPRWFIL